MSNYEVRALRSLIGDSEARIRALHAEIDSLTEALAAYRARLAYLETETDAQRTERRVRAVAAQPGRRGTVGLLSAVERVLRDVGGEPVHARDILTAALTLGAVTGAKNPVAVVDLLASNLRRDGKPVERVAPRTWRWAEARAS